MSVDLTEDVPWTNLVRFHRAIVRRAEEGFWALDASTAASERWSSVQGFVPQQLEGPWSIEASRVTSQPWRQLLHQGKHGTVFIGGPCFVGTATFDTTRKSCWQPLYYREVSISEREEGLEISPVGDAWILSPPVHQLLDRWQLRPDVEPDELSAQAIEEAKRAIAQEGASVSTALFRALVRLVPEVETRFNMDPRLAFPTTTPSAWVLFSPPTRVGPYNRHLLRDYDALERKLDEPGPHEVGGLSLLRPLAQPATTRHASVLPFVALNGAQERAVEAMLGGQPVTVVSGPPGCGKSQVVVSLLLNAWARGQSVLFASNNNKAVSVVAERLAKFDEDSPVAVRAGSGLNNNIATALRRVIQAAGSHSHPGDPVASRSMLLEERVQLRQALESGSPQQVDEALKSALSTFSGARKLHAAFTQRRDALTQRFRDLTGLVIDPSSSAEVRERTAKWLSVVGELRARVPHDAAKKEQHHAEAERTRALVSQALSDCALPSEALDVAEDHSELLLLHAGLREWLSSARAVLTEESAQILAEDAWATAWNRWTSARGAAESLATVRDLLTTATPLLGSASKSVRAATDARTRYAQRHSALVAAGWPSHVEKCSVPPEVLREWLSLYAQYIALPKTLFGLPSVLTRRRIRARQSELESDLRSQLPLDVWKSVGILDDAGRSRLAEILEALLRLLEERERMSPDIAAESEAERSLTAVASSALALGVIPPEAPLAVTEWPRVFDEMRALADVSEAAERGWRLRERREEVRDLVAAVAADWTRVSRSTRRIESWLAGAGRDFDRAMTHLELAVSAQAVSDVVPLLADGLALRLLQSLGEAIHQHGELTTVVRLCHAVPSEADRIAESWSSRDDIVMRLQADSQQWPDVDSYESRLTALRAWEVEWNAFYDGERPVLLEKMEVERALAVARLREAAGSIPEGSAASGLREEIDSVIAGQDEWPVSYLQERFAPFLPERINLRLEALQAELSQSAMQEGRAAWLERLRTEVESLKAATKLRHVAGDNGQGDLTTHGEIFRQALSVVPVWITTAQTTRAIPLLPHLFDLVVVDEASQCTLTNLLPMIYRAKRLVVIGDPQQLPAITVVGSSEERQLADEFDVRRYLLEYGHDRRDLFSVAREALPRAAADVIMLDEHYRSDPLIIGFANRYVYQRKLTLRRPPAGPTATAVPQGIFRVHVEGRPYRRNGSSWVNEAEAKVVLEQVRKLLAMGVEPSELGVVTPFAGQKARINDLLRAAGIAEDVHVNTAFGFQGDERQFIIFSAVVSKGVEAGTSRWVEQPPNLLNVALTRAKDGLIVVADFEYCEQQSGLLRDLSLYLHDVDILRESHAEELALFNWMTMEGWVPRVHPKIGSEIPTFVLAEPQRHRVAVVLRPLTTLENPRTEDERARELGLAAAGYRVLECTARDVRETPTAVLRKIREQMVS